MKLQLACLMAVLSLTACGEHHHSVHATERVAEASEHAFAKAPKAEAIKFDDEGMPKIHETANTPTDSTTNTATPTTANTENTDTATATVSADSKPADTATTNTATTTADTK